MPMNQMKQRRRRRRRGLSGQLGGSTAGPSTQRPTAKTAGPLIGTKKNVCFCEEEEDLLIKLHTLLGNRWSLIAGRLPGRTAKEVESYWNREMRSKLIKCTTGLDPPEKHRTTTFPLLPDVQQWRRRPRNACKVGRRPDASKHPDRPAPSSNAKVEEDDVVDDCVSDAGSAC